jgi:steroid delta-isomerase-like uncharacterized protein
MSPQANVQVAKRWFEEVWNQRRTETVYELSQPDSVGHMEHGDVTGPEAFLVFHTEFVKTFPDVKIAIEGIVAEGDEVAVRWLASATHCGEGFGCPATHKQVRFRGITWMRIRDGKIIEAWDAWNAGGLMQQIQVSSH